MRFDIYIDICPRSDDVARMMMWQLKDDMSRASDMSLAPFMGQVGERLKLNFELRLRVIILKCFKINTSSLNPNWIRIAWL